MSISAYAPRFSRIMPVPITIDVSGSSAIRTGIFVSSSINDPNPRAILEAMYMGCTVVGTRSGGVPEMIEDGKSGILVPPDDPESMTKAIKMLIENAALRAGMGQAAKKRVEDRFTIDITQRNIEEVYEELLKV